MTLQTLTESRVPGRSQTAIPRHTAGARRRRVERVTIAVESVRSATGVRLRGLPVNATETIDSEVRRDERNGDE